MPSCSTKNSTVVRARRDLVDHEHAVLQHEEFDAEHTHVVQAVGHGTCGGQRLLDLGLRQVAFVDLGDG